MNSTLVVVDSPVSVETTMPSESTPVQDAKVESNDSDMKHVDSSQSDKNEEVCKESDLSVKATPSAKQERSKSAETRYEIDISGVWDDVDKIASDACSSFYLEDDTKSKSAGGEVKSLRRRSLRSASLNGIVRSEQDTQTRNSKPKIESRQRSSSPCKSVNSPEAVALSGGRQDSCEYEASEQNVTSQSIISDTPCPSNLPESYTGKDVAASKKIPPGVFTPSRDIVLPDLQLSSLSISQKEMTPKSALLKCKNVMNSPEWIPSDEPGVVFDYLSQAKANIKEGTLGAGTDSPEMDSSLNEKENVSFSTPVRDQTNIPPTKKARLPDTTELAKKGNQNTPSGSSIRQEHTYGEVELPKKRSRGGRSDAYDGIKHIPFTLGWKREVVTRATADPNGRRNSDVYYYAPDGTKLRSMVEIGKYLDTHPGMGVTLDHFTYFKEPIYHPPEEMTRQATKRSVDESPSKTTTPPKTTSLIPGKRIPKKKKFFTELSPPPAAKKAKPMKTYSSPKSAASLSFPQSPKTSKPSIIMTIKKVPNSTDDQMTSQVKVIRRPKIKYTPTLASQAKKATSISSQIQKIPPSTESSLVQKVPPVKNSEPKLSSPGIPPCSVYCPGRLGQVPSLMCGTCLCMYHPKCVGLPANFPSAKFECKQCKTSKKSPIQNIRDMIPNNAKKEPDVAKINKREHLEDPHIELDVPLMPEVILDHVKSLHQKAEAQASAFSKQSSNQRKSAVPSELRKVIPLPTSTPLMVTSRTTTTWTPPTMTTAAATPTSFSNKSLNNAPHKLGCYGQSTVKMTTMPYTSPTQPSSTSTMKPSNTPDVRTYSKLQPLLPNTMVNSIPPVILPPVSGSAKLQVRMIRPPPGTRMPLHVKSGQSITFLTRANGSPVSRPVIPSAPPTSAPPPVLSAIQPQPPSIPSLQPVKPPPGVNYMLAQPAPGTTTTASTTATNPSPSALSPFLLVSNKDGMPQGFIVMRSNQALAHLGNSPTSPQQPLVITPPPSTATSPISVVTVPVSNSPVAVTTGSGLKSLLPAKLMAVSRPISDGSVLPSESALGSIDGPSSSGFASSAPGVPKGLLRQTSSAWKDQSRKKYLETKFAMSHAKLFESFECMLAIFKYLTIPDLLRASQVCRLWNQMASFPNLWESVSLRGIHVKDWQKLAHHLTRHGTSVLDLRGMKVTDQTWKGLLENVADFRSVDHLVSDQVPVEVLQEISQTLPCLQTLAVEDMQVIVKTTQDSNGSASAPLLNLSYLSSLKRLRKLVLRSANNIILHVDGFQKYFVLMSSLQHLRHLSLTSFKYLTSDDVLHLEDLKNLRELELGDCTGWDSTAFKSLSKLHKLRYLRLENGGDIPDRGLGDALAQLQSLEELHLVLFKIADDLGKALKKIPTLSHLALWPVPYKEIKDYSVTKSTYTSDYPCGGCKHEVHDNQKGLQCEGCLKWYHARCGLVSTIEYKRLGKSSDSWICPRCEQLAGIRTCAILVDAPPTDVHNVAVALVNKNTLISISDMQHLKEFIWGVISPDLQGAPHLPDDSDGNEQLGDTAILRTQVVVLDHENHMRIPMLECNTKEPSNKSIEKESEGPSDCVRSKYSLKYLCVEDLYSQLATTLPSTKVGIVCCKLSEIRNIGFRNC